MNFWEKITSGLKSKDKKPKIKKEEEKIPKEIMDKLPPGTKVKKIEIGPKQILKVILYIVIIGWILSIIRQLIVPQDMQDVPLSQVVETIKKNQAEEITVMDNDIVVKVKGSGKMLVSAKESTTSMAEILQRDGIDVATVKFTVQNNQGWKMVGDIL